MATKKKAKKTTKKSAASACDWNANNLACVNVNGALNSLEEIRSKFSKAKGIKMSKLAFWNPLASPSQRALAAAALSGRLDRLFRFLLGAKYESGIKKAAAVKAMKATLTSTDKTVCQLSETVDKNYRFRGEVS